MWTASVANPIMGEMSITEQNVLTQLLTGTEEIVTFQPLSMIPIFKKLNTHYMLSILVCGIRRFQEIFHVLTPGFCCTLWIMLSSSVIPCYNRHSAEVEMLGDKLLSHYLEDVKYSPIWNLIWKSSLVFSSSSISIPIAKPINITSA